MIELEQWQALLAYDELNREMISGRILNGFHALQPAFPPTFKRRRHVVIRKASEANSVHATKEYCISVNGSSSPTTSASLSAVSADSEDRIDKFYDPKRIPSFTDRILFKSLPGFREKITAESFESCEHAASSDHKPVRASFQIETTGGAKGIHVKPEQRAHGAFTLQVSNLRASDNCIFVSIA
jgi:hypothetical protein